MSTSAPPVNSSGGDRPICSKCEQVHPRSCTGHRSKRDDEGRLIPCANWATTGHTVCTTHGSRAPQAKAAASKRAEVAVAKAAVQTYGLPISVDPHQALLDEVHRTAGHVAWLGTQVAELSTSQLTSDGYTHPYVDLYAKERTHLRNVCRDALSAGVEERLVRVAQLQATPTIAILKAVLSHPLLALTEAQQSVLGDVVDEVMATAQLEVES